jgi:hypothetical protein
VRGRTNKQQGVSKEDQYRLLAIKALKERARQRRSGKKELDDPQHRQRIRRKLVGTKISDKAAKLIALAIKDMLRS